MFLQLVCFPEQLSSIIRKILVDKYTLLFSRRESVAWKYVRGFHVFKLGSRFVETWFYFAAQKFDNNGFSIFPFEFMWYFYILRLDLDVYSFSNSDNNFVDWCVRAFSFTLVWLSSRKLVSQRVICFFGFAKLRFKLLRLLGLPWVSFRL